MADGDKPVFGFILGGGSLTGGLVRDVRLANELTDRGYRVVVWWAIDRTEAAPLRPTIEQRWLFHGLRYTGSVPGVRDAAGRLITRFVSESKRGETSQKHEMLVLRMMQGMMRAVCDGVEHDAPLIRRLAGEIRQTGVTHLLPMMEFMAPWAAAACRLTDGACRYLVTFQGHEVTLPYAASIGRRHDLLHRLATCVRESAWPAIAVSADYRRQVLSDFALKESEVAAIPPGVPPAGKLSRTQAEEALATIIPGYRPGVPLVTFLGRRDVDKGVDLLLYAMKIIMERGVDFQLAAFGSSLYGKTYRHACEKIGVRLGLPIQWSKQVTGEKWSAVMAGSRVVLYPAVWREPFGMVPVEAMAHGTPAVVPRFGGLSEAVTANGRTGGLVFAPWDSGDLADKIELVITDDGVWNKLSADAVLVADHYSVTRMADRVLSHMGIA